LHQLFGIILAVLIVSSANLAMSNETVSKSPMPADKFWQIIDASAEHKPRRKRQLKQLNTELSKLDAPQVHSFDLAFEVQMQRAYTWDLWGGAYIMLGGASDDGFVYFRRWLISQGSSTFEAALRYAENLADLLPPDTKEFPEFEEFAYVGMEVLRKKTGKWPWDPGAEYTMDSVAPGNKEPRGERFVDSEEHLSKRYPKLWKRFARSPLEPQEDY